MDVPVVGEEGAELRKNPTGAGGADVVEETVDQDKVKAGSRSERPAGNIRNQKVPPMTPARILKVA
jgi:hypothetical protein